MKKRVVILVMALSVVMAGCGKEAPKTKKLTSEVEKITENEENPGDETSQEAEETKTETSEVTKGIGYITWSDYFSEDTEDYHTLINTTNTYINVTSEGYEALNNALEKHNEKERSEAESFMKANLEDAKELLEAMDYSVCFANDSEDNVYRADTQVFSFANYVYTYLGGAHPGTYTEGVTYDSQTGSQLTLKDVVTDYDRLYEITLEKLAVSENAEGFFEDYETTVKDKFYGTGEYELTPPEFWLTDKGMKLFFNEYDIASYAAGTTEIEITYEEYPELFNSKYVYRGEGQIQTGDETNPVFIDVNGVQQEVKVETEVNDDEYTIDMKISVGDKSSDFNFYGYYAKWHVLTDRDGNSYMYVECVVENDYTFLEVLKLGENGAEKVEEISGLSFGGNVSTDPYNMIMCERMEALGSFTGYKVYHITETGLPETDDNEYSIRMGNSSWFHGLVSTVELTVYVNGQEEAVPAGTTFYVRGTDNKSYVRAIMEDGRECEIRYTLKDEYIKMINGEISEWDAFEMLPYAG